MIISYNVGDHKKQGLFGDRKVISQNLSTVIQLGPGLTPEQDLYAG